MTETVDRL